MNGQKMFLAFQDDLPCCLVLYTMCLDVVNFQRSPSWYFFDQCHFDRHFSFSKPTDLLLVILSCFAQKSWQQTTRWVQSLVHLSRNGMQMNLVTCLHIVSLSLWYHLCFRRGTKKLFAAGAHHPKNAVGASSAYKRNLVHLEKKARNFRVVMEELTSFVFCQVPWENEYESSIVCFYSSGQQLLYYGGLLVTKRGP